jgi:hypothetical protein
MKKVINADIINESTSGVGVTVGGVLLKDGCVTATNISGASDPAIAGQYIVFTDPVSGLKSRFGARDENPVFDRELILGGFSLAEGIGWQNVGGGTES